MRDVHMPGSLDELWGALHEAPGASVFAGGTDLLVKMRGGLRNPTSLIGLERIENLKGVSDQGESIRIGGCTTHAQLLAHPLVRKHLPVLEQALTGLGSPLIRNMGTIGGNICTASPAGDTLPPLYVLGTEVELRSQAGLRRMEISEFVRGPGQTQLEDAEILAAVWVRKPAATHRHHFEKVGLRNALACSVASLAAIMALSPRGMVEDVALAWGSVGPTVFTSREVEAVLLGRILTVEALHDAADIVRRTVSPISDGRADAEYRRTVAGNLLLRLPQVLGVL